MSVAGIGTDGYYAQNGSLKCIIITLWFSWSLSFWMKPSKERGFILSSH